MIVGVGMAIAPWNVLATGKIRTDAEDEERRKTGEKGAQSWSWPEYSTTSYCIVRL